ncbi:hypothetical protein [Hymenobacter persicinus]|uniref:Uncharacterized protein n=1 Tax=Hymenobacter persicinus TaxID=2025506 RepID=A0A4Q5LFJ0_9BACT|nr:hypothetical protein [Hymenobacter persicinus]RYU83815.1 hypothetical protein EWM57_02415 [Hymenobacter persicinus]
MLAKFTELLIFIFRLSQEVEIWTAMKPGCSISPRAKERQVYLRRAVKVIFSLVTELQEMLPDSAVEASQQRPMFWWLLEQDIAQTLKGDPQLDGVLVYILKEGATEKKRPNFGMLYYQVPLEDLAA